MLSVLSYDLVAYRRTWRGSALSSFVLPVLFMVGMGVSVGHYVNQAGSLGPVRYLDYVLPGMIASTAMQVAFGESSWPIMGRFVWMRTYHGMVAAPLRIADIVGGDLAFVVLRVVSTTTVFVAVATAFHAVHSWWALVVPVVCGLVGLSFAAPLFAFAGRVETDSYFPLMFRFVMIPMSLFAGVFFPVENLALGLRILAYASPLWHAVVLCRAATLPGFAISGWAIAGHLAYLALWAVVGCWLAWLSFRARLAV